MADHDMPDLGTLKNLVTRHLSEEQKMLIGHMINNPLCSVVANLSWLLEEVDKDPCMDSDQLAAVKDALHAAHRLHAVVGTLLVQVGP